MSALAELQGGSKRYAPTRERTEPITALESVNFSLESGEFVALMGPSGSGKSTLLNLLGLLDTPTEGQVWLEGRPCQNLNALERAHLRAQWVGFVFQSFYLLPYLSALDNVRLALDFLPAGQSSSYQAQRWLEQLGLKRRMNHHPRELSGGEQQRVALARAVVKNPLLLLADEPTGNLDEGTGTVVLDLFEEINREGQTLVVATHDAQVARRAHRVVRLDKGRMEHSYHELEHAA